MVMGYLAAPIDEAWKRFAKQHRALLEKRFVDVRSDLDELAALARTNHVHLGCSCPTKKNPSVRHCHTWLALEFFRERFPDLDVRMPRE